MWPFPLSGQALHISREGVYVALIYNRARGVNVPVEQSSDLISWTVADSSTKVLAIDSRSETVKSMVAMGRLRWLFFRVPVTLYRDITLAWDASVGGAATAGYRLYYGTDSGPYTELDVGSQTNVTISIPEDGRVYYFQVTAYALTGVESLPSAEVVCPWP